MVGKAASFAEWYMELGSGELLRLLIAADVMRDSLLMGCVRLSWGLERRRTAPSQSDICTI